MTERNYWKDKELVELRERYINEEGYKEFEGCHRCITEKCIKEHVGYTMAWLVLPLRQCDKHPRFKVRKTLINPLHPPLFLF